MSDYLSPGVYIEELPPQLRAIEGVSTSTAGFVGTATRGVVPGSPLPFTPSPADPQAVTLVPTPTPVLVTSFSRFVNQFGEPLPLPDPTSTNYLGYAVMGFFSNGGQELYISRVAPGATYGFLGLSQGNLLRLSSNALSTDTTLNFVTLRGIANNGTLSFYHKDGTAVMSGGAPLTATIASYNAQSAPPTVTLSVQVGVALAKTDVYVTTDTLAATGPIFWARSQGSWSSQIAVTVTPSRRRAVALAMPASNTATQIQVASTSGFYQGAIIEIDTGIQQIYTTVSSIGAGGVLGLNGAVGVALTTSANVRIVEIDINIVDPSTAVPISETFIQLTWNPDPNPNVRSRHYSTVINAQSQLVYVQPPGVGGASGTEDATLATQPTTFNGQAFSINATATIYAAVSSAVNNALANTVGPTQQEMAQAGSSLQTAVDTLAQTALPVAAANAAVTAVTTAVTALTAAATKTTALSAGLPASLSTALTAASKAVAAANDAVTQAQTNPQTATTGSQLANDKNTVEQQATAIANLGAGLNTVAQAATALKNAVNALAGTTLPVTTASPAVIAVTVAATSLTNAVTAATAGLYVAPGSPGAGLLSNALASLNEAASAANTAATAATDAVAQAETNPQTPTSGAQLANDKTTVAQLVGSIGASTTVPTSSTMAQAGNDNSIPQPSDYVGQDNGPGQRSGIQALKDAEAIRIIAAPGQTDLSVQGELINQCELLRYRFAVLDGEQNPAGGSVNAILAHRDTYDTSYAAYYVPWLQFTLNNQNVYLPPSGHVIGIYAATDNSRGVWKAPANVVVQGITGLKTYIVKGEQDLLNPAGVNAIRRFDTLGTRVWGARTLSSDSSLIYVNVRRTLIFLEASIDQGTQWVVFEPNTPGTWDRLTDAITAFLTAQWADGALFGAKPTDAFFVRCDETTMTADDIQNGRLICLIGVAIVRPAEFVIFRIEQTTGYANQ